MRFRIRHATRYDYQQPVSQAINLAYLSPRETARQTCTYKNIEINPSPTSMTMQQDYFGNEYCHFTLEQPHNTLEVIATSEVDTYLSEDWPSLNIGNTCGQAREQLAMSTEVDCILAREYLLSSPLIEHNEDFAHYAAPIFTDDKLFLGAVRELCAKIFNDFQFDPHFSEVNTPLVDVFASRKGVCQDFAHFAIACLRSLGYPAKYVSGYLETLPPPGFTKLIGSDATHAWVAVYSPSEGWFEFDPTNNSIPGEQHILTAWGRDYSDVTPLRGVIVGGGSAHTLNVSVDVHRCD